MKLKVTLTRRPNVNINDFDFLTETLLQEVSKIKQLRNQLNNARKQLHKANKNDTQNIRRLTDKIKKLNTELDAAVKAAQERKQAKRDNASVPVNTKGGALVPVNTKGGALVPVNTKGGALVPATTTTVSGTFQQKAVARLRNMMNQFGNDPNNIFRKILEWLKGIPWLTSLGSSLISLWGKIKKWFSKFHIVDRAKSLSIVVVACIGFLASMVITWTYRIIFKINGKQQPDPNVLNNMTNYSNSYKNMMSRAAKVAFKTQETAVFIETFGEILREDSNGGALVTMAGKAITSVKNSGKAKAVVKALNNSSNKNSKRLANVLQTSIDGADAALKNPSAIPGAIPATETRFDDSLPALYESIIWEAQAHKIKEIKKKARKKVAIKKARSKKALRGRM